MTAVRASVFVTRDTDITVEPNHGTTQVALNLGLYDPSGVTIYLTPDDLRRLHTALGEALAHEGGGS